jgi:hypothetical protein
MATDRDIEQFISDSFASIWDLELLSVILQDPKELHTADALVERMRASEQVVKQGIQSLVAAGLAAIEPDGRLKFRPVNAEADECARRASDFYIRFPGRARRLMIARQSPALTAFANAFRLRKD